MNKKTKTFDTFQKCDVCGIENKEVVAGRWIFYCPKHKNEDWAHTYENEIKPDLQNGDFSYILDDGELQEMMLENL